MEARVGMVDNRETLRPPPSLERASSEISAYRSKLLREKLGDVVRWCAASG